MNRKDTLHWLAQGIINIDDDIAGNIERGSAVYKAMASALDLLTNTPEIAERFYIALSDDSFGKGITIEGAKLQLKLTGYQLQDGYMVKRLPANAHSVTIGPMGDISWRGNADGVVDLPVVAQRNGSRFKRDAPVCGTAYNDTCHCELCESYCNEADRD